MEPNPASGTLPPVSLPLRRTSPTQVPAEYERIRAEQPVCPVTLPTGDPAWLVTRNRDARQVMTDRRLSRAAACAADAPRMLSQPPNPELILYMDPPRHTRVRRIAAAALDGMPIDALRVQIADAVDDLLTGMVRAGGPVDLNAAYARPLPLRVICTALGVAEADLPAMTGWTEKILSLTTSPDERLLARQQMAQSFARLIGERTARPEEDVTSRLISLSAADPDGGLTATELVSLTMTLLIAGHESSVTILANAAILLMSHRDQLTALLDDRDLMPGAVEELLRLSMPGTSPFLRIATAELEIGGTALRAGEAVTVNYESALRDPEAFSEPERLDVRRRPQPGTSLYFGHGAHYCLGSGIARAQLEIGLWELFHKFPTLRLAVDPGELRWRDDAALGGFTEVPVTW
jgi:cytochrome P450